MLNVFESSLVNQICQLDKSGRYELRVCADSLNTISTYKVEKEVLRRRKDFADVNIRCQRVFEENSEKTSTYSFMFVTNINICFNVEIIKKHK